MESNASNNRTKKIALTALKLVLLIIVFYFIFRQFDTYWSDLVAHEWSVNFTLLALSIFLHLVALLLFSSVWSILIKAFGFTVKLKHAFKISYITSLGKYIPGKLWPIVGMSFLAKQLNISEENAIASWIIAMIFYLPSAFLASFLCILATPEIFTDHLKEYLDWTIYLMALVVFVVSLLLIIKPNMIFSIINIILRKLKRPLINLNLNIKTALKIYTGYMVCWIVFGFSFWLLIISISPSSDVPIIPSMVAFIFAYQLGYLAFFAPGGIGVRELVLTTILLPYIGPIAASISIAARIWNMITEIVAAVICLIIKFPKQEK